MTVMAAIDLGAQSGRVAAGRFDGSRLELTEAHRFPNEPIEEGGRLRWDFDRLAAESLDGLRAAARDREIDSVGVDSWAIDFGLVDRDGRLIANPVHYRDHRRAEAAPELYRRIPPRELYGRTGIQMLSINTACELVAMTGDGDPALEEAERLLMIPDLLHHRLCGSVTTELTNATTTQCFDPFTGDWAEDVLERAELPARLFPEVVPPASVLGPVGPDAANETGLTAARVIASATHDTASAVAAVPFRRPGSAFLSVGTWSLVGVEVPAPVVTDETFAANLTNEGGVAGTFRLLRNVTGLWLLHECRRRFAELGRDYTFEQLVALAEQAAPLRSLVDPDDPSFAEPGDMPERIAEFCRATGQPVPTEPGDVARCIVESLALKHAETIDLLRDAAGAEPAELHVVGGGARNALLCTATADAAGLPVLAGPEEATLIGNLLVQAMALGELSSLEELREVVRASFDQTVYEPTPSTGWQEAQARFAALRSDANVGVSA